MKNFGDILMKAVKEKNSALICGLDPNLDYFPLFLKDTDMSEEKVGNAIFEFNKIVIDAVHESVVAVKPQLAYYEVFGSYGIRALEKTIKYAKSKNLIVIHDAKRGDIGSTSVAYAEAFLGNGSMAGDMVTVNPYLGSDGYLPFVNKAEKNGKGIFMLLKTSNPSSSELQNLTLENGNLLYEELANNIKKVTEETVGENGYSFIGAVVGATHPMEAEKIRKELPHTPFLVPGFGAQGGDVDKMKVFFDKDGLGAVISSSRGIIYSYTKKVDDWKNISEKEMGRIIGEKAKNDNELINRVRLAKY